MIFLWVCLALWLAIAVAYWASDPSWEQLAIGLLLPPIFVLAIVEAVFG